jgi:hypothetical protein
MRCCKAKSIVFQHEKNHGVSAKCNFDMNMSLKNVESSVLKFLTEKEMIYHQRLVEIEDRWRTAEARIEYCGTLRAATPVNNLATSGPISSDSDHYLSVRSSVSQNSVTTLLQDSSQTEDNLKVAPFISMTCSTCRASQVENTMTSCLSVLSNESGADEASRMSESSLEHIKAYIGNEYASEWSRNLEKMDDGTEKYLSMALASSEVESVEASVGGPDEGEQMVQMEFFIDKQAKCGGVELMIEREGVVDGEEEGTAIMSGHHSVLEELQRRLEQMIRTESIVNNKDECSWSECEHQQDEPQPRLEQLAVGQVWTHPRHQNQQIEQQQEQLLSDRSTTELVSAPNHTIATAHSPALRLHSVELEEKLTGKDDKEAEEKLHEEQF